jgi:hypothetical protein
MQLYTGFHGLHRINELHPTPFIIPVTRPSPTEPIGIIRSVCRIRGFKLPLNLYAATLHLVRASDGAIMGDVSINRVLSSALLIDIIAERDVDWGTDNRHFRLEVGDDVQLVFQTHIVPGNPPDPGFIAEVDILFAYAKFNPAFNPANPVVHEFL